MTNNQKTYLFSSIIGIGFGLYFIYEEIANGRFPNSLMLIALGLNQLMLAYLSPHIFPKDERSKEIMGKAMTINYFVLFGTILVLFLLTASFGPLTLDSSQVLIVLSCIMPVLYEL
ncbi:hypothetical protein ACQKMV_15615 [Lysinibacillus sp. NPDC094403]|uniref:hypothetical protein n=1 Tax=Lysinibacillus sp. NPDC094403 TaxID=3390581 RepID=UPI003D05EBB4